MKDLDDQEQFDEVFSEKEDFCTSLNMKDITSRDFRHSKRAWRL